MSAIKPYKIFALQRKLPRGKLPRRSRKTIYHRCLFYYKSPSFATEKTKIKKRPAAKMQTERFFEVN